MIAFNGPLCIHCEQRPAETLLDLCIPCHAHRNIRPLYARRPNWTPQWEAHLRRLAQRAKQRLPLVPDEPPSARSPREASAVSLPARPSFGRRFLE